jgi:predicted component of type VI protein secretion system
MDVQLVLLQGGKRTRAIRLRSQDAILGRRRGCDVRVAAHEISRQHCRIRTQGTRVTVADLGSANGTYINGQLLTDERLVRSGDQLRIGSVTFVLEYGPLPLPRGLNDPHPGLQCEQSVITDGIVVVEGDEFDQRCNGAPLKAQPVAPLQLRAVANGRRASGQEMPLALPADDEIPFAEVEENDIPFAESEEGPPRA